MYLPVGDGRLFPVVEWACPASAAAALRRFCLTVLIQEAQGRKPGVPNGRGVGHDRTSSLDYLC